MKYIYLLILAPIALAISMTGLFVLMEIYEPPLPIEGMGRFIEIASVDSYGSTGDPPCVGYDDQTGDCYTNYKYAITATDKDVYRLKESFPVKFEQNNDFKVRINRQAVYMKCEWMGLSSRDSQNDYCCSKSDRNYFFGCEML